jgi:ketosteroid isomerase-like protein
MSQENVELVKQGFEHLLATGEPLWSSIASELEVHDHHSPDQGAYEGHAGLRQWLGDWDSAWEEWSVAPERFVDAGDSVVVIYRMRVKGKGSGLELDLSEAQVWELRSGEAVRLDVYGSAAEALEAVGLSE